MAKAVKTGRIKLNSDSATALPVVSVNGSHGALSGGIGYEHLVALARFMGRQAAAEAIRAGRSISITPAAVVPAGTAGPAAADHHEDKS